MRRVAYIKALGCVVSYKNESEPLLFNELNARCQGVKLTGRGRSAAMFTLPDYAALVSAQRTDPFVFLRHVHPVLRTAEISGTTADFTVFADMLNLVIPYIEDGDTLTCQCRLVANEPIAYANGDLNTLLAEALKNKGYPIDPKAADTVVSLTVFDHIACMGISRPEDNASRWSGGVLFFAKAEDDLISRAEFKLEEAFEVFDIQAREGMRALDLGAAPGGWTNYLAQRGLLVDAVDPAELSGAVLRNPNVTHYKMTAQEFAQSGPKNHYDIIVNDMRMDTRESVDITRAMSVYLSENGCCVLTLKLPKGQVQKRINSAREMLSKTFEAVQVRQLYYNRSEVTIMMKSKRR